jgi:hypothetical protein
MNSRQAAQYARGLEIAKRDALEVHGHGVSKSDGAPVYAVPSRSQQNTWYLVVVNGLELTCDCQAGQHNRYCAHRAAVRARLELEAAVRRDTHEREVERLLHEAARELETRIDARAALNRSPKPRDDQRVFSFYK